MNKTRQLIATGLLTGLLAACSTTPELPATTFDGLNLVPDTKFGSVYSKDDANLHEYSAIALVDCQVAFKKNWLRDQRRDNSRTSGRVSQKDVDNIKAELSKLCNESFAASLSTEPGYKLVTEATDDETVLLIRPSIINLDISAPDTMSAGRNYNFTTSSGEMTLYMELYDGRSGEIIARVLDRRRQTEHSRMRWTTSVSNRSDAMRTLNRWTGQLREGLDLLMRAPAASNQPAAESAESGQ